MPSNFWFDGKTKWSDGKEPYEKKFKNEELDFENTITENLVGCDIKTNVINESWKVERNGVLLKHFMNSGTTSWEVEKNVMTVHTEDEVPFKLIFISIAQAKKGDNRLFLIINGENIQGCEDDNINALYAPPTNPQVNFI